MAHAPFSGEFESLARQYWNTWNELLGRPSASDAWGMGSMGSMGSLGGFGGLSGLPPGLGRMDPGAYDWFQRIQRLAADFSNGGQAADIASAWRDMLGGQGADPFAGMLRSMHGGLAGGDWLEQMRPLLDMLLKPLRQQRAEWLQRPAFGPAREHQERLQALALAWQQWEERNEAFNAILAQAGEDAFKRFERLLEQHDAPGKRLESARALFDLWIDAAEEAWAEIAMSAEYRHAYAEMTNALMRLRLGLQREVEQFGAMLGLPGRSELDAVHRKVADLERALHAARRGAAKPAQAAASRPARPATVAASAEVPVAETPAAVAASPATAKARRPKARKRVPAATAAKVAEAAKVAKVARKRAPARKPASAAAIPKAPAREPAHAAKVLKAPKVSKAAKTPKSPDAPKKPAAVARKTATPRRAPVKAAARRAPQASTSTARKARVASPANGAARRAPARTAATAPAPAKVVSMKDWVSRNLASATPDAPSRGKARK